jgi:protein-tyrosine phosphatase
MVKVANLDNHPKQANDIEFETLGKSVEEARTLYPLTSEQELLEKRTIEERTAGRKNYSGPSISSIGKKSSINNWTRHNFGERGLNIISNNIVIGSNTDAKNHKLLKDIGVTHIINSASNIECHFPDDFVYHTIPLEDKIEETLGKKFFRAMHFLRRVEAYNGRVLVHCKSGVSRAVTIVLAYLMIGHRIRLKESYLHVKSLRPFIAPNDGFKLQLAKIELEIFNSSSVANYHEWDFYLWNNIKHTVKSINIDGDLQTCCIIL